jgi:Uma2 family endonuclease
MVQTPSKSITLEEFLKLPETKPASEFIDGQIIQKPMPQGKHSTVQRDLTFAAETVLKPKKIARAYPELRCTFGGRSIVPDIAVFTWDRIPRDENGKIANVFQAAPDWAIEILSPDQSQTKLIKKILHCLESGTQMGWIIDPDEETVFAYPPQQPARFFDMDAPEEVLSVPSFASEMRLTVGEIFGWLAE